VAGQGSLREGSLTLKEVERAGDDRESARGTCRLDDVSDVCTSRGLTKTKLTIEYIVIALLFNFRAQSCRYRSVRSVVRNPPIAPLRWFPAQDGPAPLRRLPAHNMAASLRRLPFDLALALLRQFPLHRTGALLGINTGDTATPSIAHALRPAVPATPSTRRRTGKSARRASAHGGVLALETLAAPSIGEAERVEMLLVLLLRRRPVFGPRHRLTGLVNIAGPSLVGVCGVGLGEGAVVGIAGAPEEGLGASADGHCRVRCESRCGGVYPVDPVRIFTS